MKKKRKKVTNASTSKQKKISVSGIVGLAIGLSILGSGLYSAIGGGETGGYFVAVIGFCFTGLVIGIFFWSSRR